MLYQDLIILLLSVSPALASPIANSAVVKRSIDELADEYDYIVVGGGTSGLAVANRLSEDSSKEVLVVEIGYFADEACIWMPSGGPSFGGPAACAKHAFNETGVPQPGINNKSFTYAVGAAVGGSSAVNGMFFDRGSKSDYNAWGELGNPGWDWENLFPYFKKSTTFTPPADEYVKKYGYTWDKEAYGNGPIQATYPPFQWEGQKEVWNAWDDLNVTGPVEHALGDAVGRFWVPASQHPVNQTRSYARYGYYDLIQQRKNFHLLIGHKVETVVISDDLKAEGVVLYQRDSPKEKATVKAKGETILAAGAVHSPQILELSGIGSKKVLEAAGIAVKVDLPGVGENFQDHPQVSYGCNFMNKTTVGPELLRNSTAAAQALAQYQNNKTGPYTLALGNSAVFLPLRSTHSSISTFLSTLSSQSPSSHLTPDLPDPVIRGYTAQQRILHSQFSALDNAAYESPFQDSCGRFAIMQKPLSRGNVHVSSKNPLGAPVIDSRVFSNPLDVEQAIEFVKFGRRFMRAPSIAHLQPVETGPGAFVKDDDAVEMGKWVRRTSGPSSFHVCGTTAMMPRDLGGVVDPQLRVYGVAGLRVVDAGIFPLVPGTHLSATVYAVAEKAADLIKGV